MKRTVLLSLLLAVTYVATAELAVAQDQPDQPQKYTLKEGTDVDLKFAFIDVGGNEFLANHFVQRNR